MIKVNGKELEVGDIVKFRCGGESAVLGYDGGDAVYLPDADCGYYCYKDNGNMRGYKSHLLDIIDIIKKPKPEIVDITSQVIFEGGIFSRKTEQPILMKYNETFEHLTEPIKFKLRYKLDVTNNKILSVEVCDE